MTYIIPITLLSLATLFLTTIKRVPVDGGKRAKVTFRSAIDKDAFTDIIRQVVIVFLSALLAMWLTEYVEQKTTRNKVQSLAPQIQISMSSQVLQVGGEIRDICGKESTAGTSRDEQLAAIIKQIEMDDINLWEATLYNESFVSVVDPMSFMHLNIDLTKMKHIKEQLLRTDLSSATTQEICELIAEYLYYGTDAAFSLQFLAEDIEFNLLLLATLEDEHFESDIYYSQYNQVIKLLEDHFGCDLSAWEGKRQYSKA